LNIQKFQVKELGKVSLLFCILYCNELLSIPTGIISVVYNLRVSETTKFITEEFTDPFGFNLTFFEEARWQNRLVCQKKNDTSNAVGELASFLYVEKPLLGRSWYLQANFAVARVSEKSDGQSLVRIQTDDLLLTAGYSWSLHSRVRFTVSGLLGIPTHKDTSLDQVQFGTGHLAFGIQFDTAFHYYQAHKCSIRLAARLIGTIPRNARFNGFDYNYNLGEVIDLLIGHHASFGHHCIEFGYNPTFVVASDLYPDAPTIESQLNLIRNSYYLAYEYSFDIKKVNNAVEFGLSFGSDVKPRRTGQKLIIFGWFTWDVSF